MRFFLFNLNSLMCFSICKHSMTIIIQKRNSLGKLFTECCEFTISGLSDVSYIWSANIGY